VYALIRRGWRACAIALLSSGAFASGQAHSVFSINEPWVKVAADGRSAEVYMRLTSSEGARLVSVTSPVAERITIRAPGNSRGEAGEVVLPAKQLVSLERGRYRIRLAGLAHKPKLGDRIPLTIVLRGDDGHVQQVPLDAEVRLHSPTEDEGRPHHVHAHVHTH
jgi:periplasmic copper chaperone A